MMSLLMASVLVLQPALAEDTHLRVVAVGTEEDSVQWLLNGTEVAVTRDGEAATIWVTQGTHELRAVSEHRGEWLAMARPEPTNTSGAQYVPAWTARHIPVHHGQSNWQAEWWMPASIAGLAAVLGFYPRRRRTQNEHRSIPKGP
jgi:hypothetical protein